MEKIITFDSRGNVKWFDYSTNFIQQTHRQTWAIRLGCKCGEMHDGGLRSPRGWHPLWVWSSEPRVDRHFRTFVYSMKRLIYEASVTVTVVLSRWFPLCGLQDTDREAKANPEQGGGHCRAGEGAAAAGGRGTARGEAAGKEVKTQIWSMGK